MKKRMKCAFCKVAMFGIFVTLSSVFLAINGNASAMDKLSLQLVYTGTKQKDDGKYGTAQGFAVTDKFLIVFTRPNGGRYDGHNHNKMYVIDRNTLKDVTKTYSPSWDSNNTGARNYLNFGHANGATWDSKRNRIIVVDDNRKMVVDLSTKPFKTKGSIGGKYASAIAYDNINDQFYEVPNSSKDYYYRVNNDFSGHKQIGDAISRNVNQDIGFNKGYLYAVSWSKSPSHSYLLQHNAQGKLINTYDIDSGEFEGIGFANNEAYLVKTGCTGSCSSFYIYKVKHDSVWRKLMRLYTITYDANGGKNAPAKQDATINSATTISSSKPTRDGYTFQGWSKSKSSSTVVVKAGGKYTGDKDVTLYAVWKAKEYKVTYNANGGTGAPAAQTANATKTIKISNDEPSRSGYTFKGWAKTKTATRAEYQPGDTYSGGVSITLYAVWQVKTFTISYNANGGTGAPASETANALTDYKISSTKPTRTGFKFLGWAKSATATSAGYMSGKSYHFTKATTLYAVWEEKTYKITYNANGGKGAPVAQTNKYTVATKISTTKPTRKYYTFLGWSKNKNATSAQYVGNDTYTGGVSMTLYAVWQENTRTVTYNANGGTGAPAAQSAKVNTAITISSAKPTRENFTFVGWGTSANAKVVSYEAGDSYTSKESITLYAIWEENEAPVVSYTVSFNANGGTGAPANQTVEAGQKLTIPSTTPSRENYNFIGWSLDNNATSADYLPGKSYMIKSNVTLYAVWSVKTFTITYDANGGEGAPEEETLSVLENATITNDEPLREGYVFMGWAKSASATDASYHAGDQYDGKTDVTLYAVWAENVYVVTYDANGGSGAPAAERVNFGVMAVISATEPTRSGYTFIGWGSAADSDSPVYFAGDSYLFDEDVTLYAIWVKDAYKVVFDPNGGEAEPEAQVGESGQAIIITTEMPLREGYNFIGWSRENNATEPSILGGDEFVDDKDVILYAVWAKDSYLVSFNTTGSEDVIEARLSKRGAAITIPDKKPTRTGFDFLGWASLEDADVEYHPGDTYDEGVSKELFAVWEKNTEDDAGSPEDDSDEIEVDNPNTIDTVTGISAGLACVIAAVLIGGAKLGVLKRR